MTKGEEAEVLQAAKRFIQENIPEYIASGAIADRGRSGTTRVSLKKIDDHWDVSGQFQTDDFQIYNAELGINLKDPNELFLQLPGLVFRRLSSCGRHRLASCSLIAKRQSRGHAQAPYRMAENISAVFRHGSGAGTGQAVLHHAVLSGAQALAGGLFPSSPKQVRHLPGHVPVTLEHWSATRNGPNSLRSCPRSRNASASTWNISAIGSTFPRAC
jgi:hypothetical protein